MELDNALLRSINRSDKELDSVREELSEKKGHLEKGIKAKSTAEKSCRQLEDRMAEISAKVCETKNRI